MAKKSLGASVSGKKGGLRELKHRLLFVLLAVIV